MPSDFVKIWLASSSFQTWHRHTSFWIDIKSVSRYLYPRIVRKYLRWHRWSPRIATYRRYEHNAMNWRLLGTPHKPCYVNAQTRKYPQNWLTGCEVRRTVDPLSFENKFSVLKLLLAPPFCPKDRGKLTKFLSAPRTQFENRRIRGKHDGLCEFPIILWIPRT